MKIYEAMAEAFLAEGADTVFGVMGDGNLHWMVAMGQRGARMVNVRHEAAAVAMADAYAQAGPGLGAAAVTCGPGLTQVSTTLIAAVRSKTPLVLMAGDTSTVDVSHLQDIDQRRFVEMCGAEFVPVRSVESAAEDLRLAFYRARSQRIPVVLDCPIDVQEQEYPWDWEYRPTPVDGQRVRGDEGRLAAAAERLMTAQRPLLLAGRGAVTSDAAKAIVDLGAHAGALLATTLPAKGLFAQESFQLGVAGAFCSGVAEELFAEADLVVSFGASLNYFTTEGGLLFSDAHVVAVDLVDHAAGESRPADDYIVADAATAAEELLELVRARGPRRTGFRTPDVARRMTASLDYVGALADDADRIEPRSAIRLVDDLLSESYDVALGTGHYWSFPVMYLRNARPGHWFLSHYFGSIGHGLPTGIGVGVAHPDRRVVVIEGDGSLMMHLQELDTAVRLGLDLLVVVMNDHGFGAEVHKLRAVGMAADLAATPAPPFDAVARALGGDGMRVTSEADMRRGLAEFEKSGGVYVLDLQVAPGAVGDDFLKLYFGQPNQAPHQGAVAPGPAEPGTA
jgi:thiamine pyrophosphate-dependent acetolactate synthase large subunit-like protein